MPGRSCPTSSSFTECPGFAAGAAAGWGAGLLIHGLAVWLVPPGGSLWQRLLERERAALQRRQGTH